MTEIQHDTQPSLQRVSLQSEDEGIAGPPRALFYGCIILFVLVIVGIGGGILVFREVLRPSQQQRVLEQVPLMHVFLRPTPQGGTLPTVEPNEVNADAANALLTMPLLLASPTVEAASVPVVENTPEATPLPTSIPATPTTEPITAPPTAEVSLPTVAAVVSDPLQSPAMSAVNLPSNERIVGFKHEQQTWNNCGPTTVTMAMSYFGWTQDQAFAASILRPNREDKNVSPSELADFVNTQSQLSAMVRMGGDLDTLKSLIANKFPVIIERGIMFEAYDWVGHYQLLVAYNDSERSFYAFDSFLGTGAASLGVVESYQTVDSDWRAFNRTYIVVYNPADEALLQSILGDRFDERKSAQMAFDMAQTEARTNRQDGFAWFNMGTSLVALERYAEAARAFDQARQLDLPWRMLWYQFAPFEAYYQQSRYDDVLSLVQSNLNSSPELEESYYWRGRVYAAQGDRTRASTEYNRALNYNSRFQPARDALQQLG